MKPMRRTLFIKLIVCFSIVIIATFTILNTIGTHNLKTRLIHDKQTALYNEAQLISEQYVTNYYNRTMDYENLTDQLNNINTFLGTQIWLVRKNGTVQVNAGQFMENDIPIDVNALDKNFLNVTSHDNTYFKGIFKEPMISVVYKVTMDYETRGYIVMFMSINKIINEGNHYMDVLNTSFLLFFCMLLLVFLYLYLLMLRPMKKILKAMKQYTDGKYDYPLVIKSHDEYRDMANAVTYMSGELKSLDDYQKKFVANISHDFRSPLTSIKGYAEAILDGTIPYEMQNKYLGIISFETDRLTKLTTNLLSLNSYGTNATLLDIVSFDINHIIKKTAESFEGICTKKKITLKLVFSDKETLVDADMGKIQQVLYNLLDNAVKFSHSNSSIRIETASKNDKVFISVKDFGVGIPKESIKKIWERFYKTDPSRGKDKKGTGLGLSITKEIINSHNENINVISTEGVGTEFIFSLPKTED